MPSVERVTSYGGRPWIQTIYQSVKLTNAQGKTPETVVARQMSEALDRLGIDHEVHYGFDPVPVSTEQAYCGSSSAVAVGDQTHIDTGRGIIGDPPLSGDPNPTSTSALGEFSTYVNEEAPKAAADSNALLTNVDGGGCAWVGGRSAVAGATHIGTDPGEFVPHTEPNNDWGGNVYAAIHEIGHNMGFAHEDNAGMSFNDHENEWWWQSPMGTPDTVNRCDEQIPPKQYVPIAYLLEYHDCVAQAIEIERKPPLEPNTNPDIDLSVSGLTVTVDARGSTSDAAIENYIWQFGDGTRREGFGATHTYTEPGTYTITLEVVTSRGTSTRTDRTLAVTEQGDGNGGDAEGDNTLRNLAIVGGLGLLIFGRPALKGNED